MPADVEPQCDAGARLSAQDRRSAARAEVCTGWKPAIDGAGGRSAEETGHRAASFQAPEQISAHEGKTAARPRSGGPLPSPAGLASNAPKIANSDRSMLVCTSDRPSSCWISGMATTALSRSAARRRCRRHGEGLRGHAPCPGRASPARPDLGAGGDEGGGINRGMGGFSGGGQGEGGGGGAGGGF